MLDLFGRDLSLRFEGSDRFKTYFGMVLSLIILIGGLVMLIIEVRSIYQGKILDISQSLRQNKFGTRNWNSSHIEFVNFGFAYSKDRPIPQILDFDAGSLFSVEDQSKLELRNCSQEVYSNLKADQKKEVPINLEIICFQTRVQHMEDGRVPFLKLRKCIEDGCATEYEKQKNLNIWAFVSSDESDYTALDGKIDVRYLGVNIITPYTMSKTLTIELTEIEINRNQGLILPTQRTEQSIRLLQTSETIQNLEPDEKEFLNIYIKLDRRSTVVITKNYYNIFTILSYLGGLFNAAMIISLIIVMPVRELKFYKKLINTMFNVCIEQIHIRMAMGLPIFEQKKEALPGSTNKILSEKGIVSNPGAPAPTNLNNNNPSLINDDLDKPTIIEDVIKRKRDGRRKDGVFGGNMKLFSMPRMISSQDQIENKSKPSGNHADGKFLSSSIKTPRSCIFCF